MLLTLGIFSQNIMKYDFAQHVIDIVKGKKSSRVCLQNDVFELATLYDRVELECLLCHAIDQNDIERVNVVLDACTECLIIPLLKTFVFLSFSGCDDSLLVINCDCSTFLSSDNKNKIKERF